MTNDHAELLSALIDREPVDPEALARALEDAEAKRALVAFAALRQSLHAPAPGETEWFAAHAAAVATPTVPRSWRLVAAAALFAAAVGAGIVAARYQSAEGPPAPTRIVQLDPLAVTGP